MLVFPGQVQLGEGFGSPECLVGEQESIQRDEALAQGWRLYGSPTLAWDQESGCMKAAQAVVWHEADVVK